MPGPKRNRRERADEWANIKQWTLWPEQELYEQTIHEFPEIVHDDVDVVA